MSESAREKAVRAVYHALNSNDIPAALKLFDPQIVRIEFEGLPMAGTFRGLAEMEAHFTQGRGTWAEGGCQPERLVVVGDKVVALVFVRVRLKGKQDWLEGYPGDVFAFRGDKIIEMRTFANHEQALAWAGTENKQRGEKHG